MSRSGYIDGCDVSPWDLFRWRGAVAAAIKGERGQALLRELLEALDAMPVKELIAGSLQFEGGVCALGALAQKRGIDVANIDPEDYERVAKVFGVAGALAQEIEFLNDEQCALNTPGQRWARMRKWVSEQIKGPTP